MIRNYFRVAWRNLLQNRVLSFINIFGLASGITFALLIGLWIQYEMSFDDFQVNRHRIAKVMKHTLYNNEKNTQEITPIPVYYELKEHYPEVEAASRMTYSYDASLMYGNKRLRKKVCFADPAFLQMFNFPAIAGDPHTALKEVNAIALTASVARALFGNEDPLGKTVRFNGHNDLQVTAVLKDIPDNSSIQFDMLGSFDFVIQQDAGIRDNLHNWGNNFMMNIVELKPGASMEALSAKIGPLQMQRDNTAKNLTLLLHPMDNWHLRNEFRDWVNTGGRMQYVRLFFVIGIFVLLIACINFMNLTTARSEKRAREVGIRKAIGSRRRQLIAQFITESMLTTFLAFLLSIGLCILLLPYLKHLGFEHVRLQWSNGWMPGVMLGICLLVGLIAGSYPALYLSSFLPVKALKGALKQGWQAIAFRRGLVVTQFVISSVLIISTIIVYQQVKYAQSRAIGYAPNNMLSVITTEDLKKNRVPLKQDLLNTGYFTAVAQSSQPMTALYNSWGDFSWDNKNPNDDIAIDVILTEWDFEKAAGLTFVDGRPFSRDYPTDSNAVILNQTAAKTIGYDHPVGRSIRLGNRVLTITGVISDVLLTDPFKPMRPMVILFDAWHMNNMLLRLKPGASVPQALAAIQPVFEKYNPTMPFDYSFVSDDFKRKFDTEQQVSQLAGSFAVLAIFISCLGLFGLAMFVAERRTREIGIRKVLGASVAHLWLLLSKEFIWLVLIASLLAVPLAYWLMHRWLNNYDYRITINGWIFVGAGLMALSIALLTVSTQAVKAALGNPLKSLKTE
ncbi:ABC transporter permease [Chitinophaga vietnamensis]|uniref:ABC transporter permease n=1 Tax=Chitinophaga vietnamensis TaxID=2593957 RepID=UPI0011785F6A|nr:ABC transporter permease [Chitinophaga vietnamensis]